MNQRPEPILAPVGSADLAMLEPLVGAYYAEDGLTFDERRQSDALARLVEADALGRGWVVRLGGRAIGYVVLTWSLQHRIRGLAGYIDELFLVPEVRGRGLGAQVLALAELAAAGSGCCGSTSRSSTATARSASIAAQASWITDVI